MLAGFRFVPSGRAMYQARLDSEPFQTAHPLKRVMRSHSHADAVFPFPIRQRLRAPGLILERPSVRSLGASWLPMTQHRFGPLRYYRG